MQMTYLLAQGWTAGHAASVVFVLKPDGSWRICSDYRGLNAITQQAVEPLPHVDPPGRDTWSSFTNFDLAPGAGGQMVEDQLLLPAGPVRVEGHNAWPARGVVCSYASRECCRDAVLHPAPAPSTYHLPSRGPSVRPPARQSQRAGRERAARSVRGGLYGRPPLLQSLAGAASPRCPSHPAAGEALLEGIQVRLRP